LVMTTGVSGSADKALLRQLSGYPKALGMAGAVMLARSLLPGTAHIRTSRDLDRRRAEERGLAAGLHHRRRRDRAVDASDRATQRQHCGPPGLLRVEPHSEGLRDHIWWGAGTNATAEWAAKLGMNLQSSTLKIDESGKPFHVQQAEQIRLFCAAWKEAGHARSPRVSVSRSIFALVDDRDRMYFGHDQSGDQIGMLSETERAITEPDVLIEQLKGDEAIAEADTILLTVPNQLGVEYNAHVLEAILKYVAPGLGWR
jgi:alkanesulfonate monooxygenase SsuD/methylene tetrahydromethanopterin reductase-like flavin-dependent oxidoreductase (luciferase family)